MGQAIHFWGERRLGVYSAAEVRAFDEFAINSLGIDSFGLMTKAAADAFAYLLKQWPNTEAVRCYCGAGNNGGDGLVLAALAKKHGLQAEVVLLASPETLQRDAKKAYMQSLGAGVRFLKLAQLTKENVQPATVLVDALLGTGQNRAPAGDYAAAIASMNDSASPVLALDIPTGICADSGLCLGDVAVTASATMSFIALKAGLLNAAAWPYTGTLCVSDLSLPARVYNTPATTHLYLQQQARTALRPRAVDSHKGEHGRCLIAGGNTQYSGAVLMSAKAALRSGAGLVSVVSHQQHAMHYPFAQPEIMSFAFDESQALSHDAWQAFDTLAVGPGLGDNDWAIALLTASIQQATKAVLDADALNLLAAGKATLAEGDYILTPHPAEAARLLGVRTADVQADRFAAAKELANRYNAVVILKGAGTLVCAPNGNCSVLLCGNAGMATGGSGDVLTGIVASLWAQGLTALDAARVAVFVHGTAADLCAEQGQRGMLPTDVIEMLPKVVN